MSLQSSQQLFWDAVTGQRDVSPEEIDEVFVSTPDLPASERLDIYRNMYFWRIVDVLQQDFPKVAELLGEDGFVDLVRAYLKVYPSRHFSIAKLGQHLATYLREHPRHGARPDLADLAELEWARSQVFDAEDAVPATAESLAGLDGEGLANVRLTFVPALRLLELDFSVAPLWLALDTGEPAPAPRREYHSIAVWRHDFDVLHAVLESLPARVLRQALEGAGLAEVCEELTSQAGGVDEAFATVGSWFADGWVAAEGDARQSPSGDRSVAQASTTGCN